MPERTNKFGTAPVFFTAISTILGAILFLRFGFAVGHLGFWGVVLIILLGHVVTIPTALAISEIATNKRVEGGGEYFIISRSFGLNIGATIGLALFLSQAISVAFYIIAFTEAFEFLFNLVQRDYGILLPRQAVSIPVTILLGLLIVFKGSSVGVKTLYIVVTILFTAITMFFIGEPIGGVEHSLPPLSSVFDNSSKFFMVFAIVFPAFTGITAGVGLSGDLKNPAKSIPAGTIMATFGGMIIYIFIAYKLATSASSEELLANQLIMGQIAFAGEYIVPIGLAAASMSSAIGSILVAPRTLQALSRDGSFPVMRMNKWLSKGDDTANEPINATFISIGIALIFVGIGSVDIVAEIISMFFMVTYGSISLISFLNQFGASPSYRPRFKSTWYISFIGFIASIWIMFKINTFYAFVALILMVSLYLYINHVHKDRSGIQSLFANSIFQLIKSLHVYIQKTTNRNEEFEWRPSAIAISENSFRNSNSFRLLNWISYKYGFGTYVHLIDGYYSKETYASSKIVKQELIERYEKIPSQVFVTTMISPSYISAVAQSIQLPGLSGMDNNMLLYDIDINNEKSITHILDTVPLVKSGNFDIGILRPAQDQLNIKDSIHVWIRTIDINNANLMIMLSFIILGHPDWKNADIKIFEVCAEDKIEETKATMENFILNGRLPITLNNIEFITEKENVNIKNVINNKSKNASLTILGFREEALKLLKEQIFEGYDSLGDILFVNSHSKKDIV